VLWKLRAIVYGSIAVVAALVLIGFGGGEEGPAFFDGRTSQDRGFTIKLEDGRPTSLGMSVDRSCGDGATSFVRWWSFDGKTSRFRFADGRLEVRETVSRTYDYGWKGERKFSLSARVGDEGVRGTMSYVETVRRAGDSYVCGSPEVTFSAG
jgi:hypothetical protein